MAENNDAQVTIENIKKKLQGQNLVLAYVSSDERN